MGKGMGCRSWTYSWGVKWGQWCIIPWLYTTRVHLKVVSFPHVPLQMRWNHFRLLRRTLSTSDTVLYVKTQMPIEMQSKRHSTTPQTHPPFPPTENAYAAPFPLSQKKNNYTVNWPPMLSYILCFISLSRSGKMWSISIQCASDVILLSGPVP
jgi:hypothetical protein